MNDVNVNNTMYNVHVYRQPLQQKSSKMPYQAFNGLKKSLA